MISHCSALLALGNSHRGLRQQRTCSSSWLLSKCRLPGNTWHRAVINHYDATEGEPRRDNVRSWTVPCLWWQVAYPNTLHICMTKKASPARSVPSDPQPKTGEDAAGVRGQVKHSGFNPCRSKSIFNRTWCEVFLQETTENHCLSHPLKGPLWIYSNSIF